MTSTILRDDFAGPGGWEEGLRILREERGIQHAPCVGIEFEASAVATARAAGQERIYGDVRAIRALLILAGYIASPPCQTFSAAGGGSGRKNLGALRTAAYFVSEGVSPEAAIAAVQTDELDERSVLVLHPLTVIRDQRPPWVALEQVPAVLPIWETYAEILTDWGYSVRTGIVNAEEYGVPQTRRRAILTAVLDGEAAWPTKTHSRYHVRTPDRIDEGYPRWVSMADALNIEPGWSMGDVRAKNGTVRDIERPSPTITSSLDNGNFQFVQRSNYSAGGKPGQTAQERGRTERTLDQPSVCITSKGFSWQDCNEPLARRKVSIEEAGVLQSFPADYPWQGGVSERYQQVGNAIPPRLAAAILEPLLRA